MLSPISTGGFDVQALPTYTAPNPQLLAKYDPAPFIAGVQGAANIGKAIQSLQVTPSETATTLAQLGQQRAQSQGLTQLPLGGLAAQQGKPPTKQVTEYNPDTGMMETNEYTLDSEGNNGKLYGNVSTSASPEGDIVHAVKGEGGNTQVTIEKLVSTVPGEPATIWDEKAGAMVSNPAAKPRSTISQGSVLPNPRIYGDAQLGQQIQDTAAQLSRAVPGSTTAQILQAQLDQYQADQEARTKEAQASANEKKALGDKAAGANATALQIASDKNATNTNIANNKNATTLEALNQKDISSWDEKDYQAGQNKLVNLWRAAYNPSLDQDSRDAITSQAKQLDKKLQQREAFLNQQAASGQSSTVTSGSNPQAKVPVMSPDDVRARIQANPTQPFSYTTNDGRQMNYAPPANPLQAQPAAQ